MPALKLYAKIIGESHRDAIVFLSGFVGSHEVWGKPFQALSDGHRLVLLDTLGFGHSPKPDIAYSLDEHLEAIRNTFNELDVNKAHIVGHSMGSLLALAYAYRFPESIARLALLALPAYRDEQEARETIKHASLFNRLLAMDTPLARLACALMCFLRPLLMPVMPMLVRDVPAVVAKDALRHTWISYSRTLQNVIFRARPAEWLRATEQPVLLIHGTKDRTAPIENVRAAIAGLPQVNLIELKAGHDFIFTHSAETAAQMERFFRTA